MARFAETSCSQCGRSFGPGDSGFSHSIDHSVMNPTDAQVEAAARVLARWDYRCGLNPDNPKGEQRWEFEQYWRFLPRAREALTAALAAGFGDTA